MAGRAERGRWPEGDDDKGSSVRLVAQSARATTMADAVRHRKAQAALSPLSAKARRPTGSCGSRVHQIGSPPPPGYIYACLQCMHAQMHTYAHANAFIHT